MLRINRTKLMNAKLAKNFNDYYNNSYEEGCLKCVFAQAIDGVENPTDRSSYFRYFGSGYINDVDEIFRGDYPEVMKILDEYERQGYGCNIGDRDTKDLLKNCIAELEEYGLVEFYTEVKETVKDQVPAEVCKESVCK